MSIPTRIIATIAYLLCIASRGTRSQSTTTTTTADTTVHQNLQKSAVQKIARKRNELTDSMLAEVINYYSKEYGSDSTRMDVQRSDTIIELDFSNVIKDTTDYNGTLLAAYISVVTDINPILTGDMNEDGVNDKLLNVVTEGGGGGGNESWNDHFLFLAKDGGYTLADVKSDPEIMDGSGYFYPKRINNQTIAGIGNSYADNDGHCCPSLYYKMNVRLKDGHMVTTDRIAISKPAHF